MSTASAGPRRGQPPRPPRSGECRGPRSAPPSRHGAGMPRTRMTRCRRTGLSSNGRARPAPDRRAPGPPSKPRGAAGAPGRAGPRGAAACRRRRRRTRQCLQGSWRPWGAARPEARELPAAMRSGRVGRPVAVRQRHTQSGAAPTIQRDRPHRRGGGSPLQRVRSGRPVSRPRLAGWSRPWNHGSVVPSATRFLRCRVLTESYSSW